MKKIKFVVFGYTSQAKWCFEPILEDQTSEIIAIIVPPKELAQIRSTYFNMWKYAEKNNIKILETTNVNNPETFKILASYEADYFFQTGWHDKINKKIINIPKRGFLSIHPSYLPYGRGGAVLNWAIINGYKKWGVTLHYLDEKLDNGPIIDQEMFEIFATDYILDVYNKANVISKKLMKRNIPKFHGLVKTINQDKRKATFLKRRTKEDGKINWNWNANKILRYIRALSKPFHGAFCYIKRNGYEIQLFKAKIESVKTKNVAPGTIFDYNEKNRFFYVKAIDKVVVIESFKIACLDKEKIKPLFEISIGDVLH